MLFVLFAGSAGNKNTVQQIDQWNLQLEFNVNTVIFHWKYTRDSVYAHVWHVSIYIYTHQLYTHSISVIIPIMDHHRPILSPMFDVQSAGLPLRNMYKICSEPTLEAGKPGESTRYGQEMLSVGMNQQQ